MSAVHGKRTRIVPLLAAGSDQGGAMERHRRASDLTNRPGSGNSRKTPENVVICVSAQNIQRRAENDANIQKNAEHLANYYIQKANIQSLKC